MEVGKIKGGSKKKKLIRVFGYGCKWIDLGMEGREGELFGVVFILELVYV